MVLLHESSYTIFLKDLQDFWKMSLHAPSLNSSGPLSPTHIQNLCVVHGGITGGLASQASSPKVWLEKQQCAKAGKNGTGVRREQLHHSFAEEQEKNEGNSSI